MIFCSGEQRILRGSVRSTRVHARTGLRHAGPSITCDEAAVASNQVCSRHACDSAFVGPYICISFPGPRF